MNKRSEEYIATPNVLYPLQDNLEDLPVTPSVCSGSELSLCCSLSSLGSTEVLLQSSSPLLLRKKTSNNSSIHHYRELSQDETINENSQQDLVQLSKNVSTIDALISNAVVVHTHGIMYGPDEDDTSSSSSNSSSDSEVVEQETDDIVSNKEINEVRNKSNPLNCTTEDEHIKYLTEKVKQLQKEQTELLKSQRTEVHKLFVQIESIKTTMEEKLTEIISSQKQLEERLFIIENTHKSTSQKS